QINPFFEVILPDISESLESRINDNFQVLISAILKSLGYINQALSDICYEYSKHSLSGMYFQAEAWENKVF
ncbi:MAG: hypothetical protein KAG10_00165, partial [Methylococcales bacterium]|nr:hypothetical protein [Methylococcales bacterium]